MLSRLGMTLLSPAHDHREPALLPEDVHPKARLAAQLVAAIAGTALEQVLDEPPVVAEDVERDVLGLVGGQRVDGRIDRDGLELAEGFDLERPAHGEIQVRKYRRNSGAWPRGWRRVLRYAWEKVGSGKSERGSGENAEAGERRSVGMVRVFVSNFRLPASAFVNLQNRPAGRSGTGGTSSCRSPSRRLPPGRCAGCADDP